MSHTRDFTISEDGDYIGLEWTPTFNLRWTRERMPMELDNIYIVGFFPCCDRDSFRLQQAWVSSDGDLEWRDIRFVK